VEELQQGRLGLAGCVKKGQWVRHRDKVGERCKEQEN
jgi:hypothetical protein